MLILEFDNYHLILPACKYLALHLCDLRVYNGHSHLLTSATDRALRLLHIDPLTLSLSPLHRFQDLINRTPWNSIGFSGDAEYVMGGAAHKMAHNVFIWDRESGVLVKVLEGPKEPLIACTVSAMCFAAKIQAGV